MLATPPSELEGRSLAEAIEETARQLERSGPERVDVQVRGDAGAVPRHVQIATLRILQEALANVRKHAGASTVRVALDVGAGLALTVTDDGAGFAAADEGFGLTSMHQRAVALGGRLAVTSRMGGPTEVAFTAPLAGTTTADDTTVSLSTPETVVRVLVVDDHTMFREGLVGLLGGEAGVTVVGGAATAGEAIAMADLLKPDIVLLDFDLPDRSGIEVAREICAEAGGPVVLMMSAFAQAVNVAEAFDVGASGYLSKDSSREELDQRHARRAGRGDVLQHRLVVGAEVAGRAAHAARARGAPAHGRGRDERVDQRGAPPRGQDRRAHRAHHLCQARLPQPHARRGGRAGPERHPDAVAAAPPLTPAPS